MIIILNPVDYSNHRWQLFLKKNSVHNSVDQSKLRGPCFCKRDETWRAKNVIFKLREIIGSKT